MAEARVTSYPVIVETEGDGLAVTSYPVIVETVGSGAAVTSYPVLVEYSPIGVNVTSYPLLIEYEYSAEPCEPRASYSFAGVDITAYCNALDLETAGKELQSTHFGSAAEEADSGLNAYSIRLTGDWSQTVDDLLGQAALSGRRATGIAQYDDCVSGARYTWASAYITNWRVATVARGKAVWSATLRHDGAPTRSIVEL